MKNTLSSGPQTTARPARVTLAALVVMRLVLAGWVGAAVLFVITSIAEQIFPGFNSATRDQLATIRFPYYFATGTACCTVALASGVLCRSVSRRLTAALVLTALASVVFALDYWFVYLPLQELIILPGLPRTDQFTYLHNWSRNLNALHLLIVLAAAVHSALPLNNGTIQDNGE